MCLAVGFVVLTAITCIVNAISKVGSNWPYGVAAASAATVFAGAFFVFFMRIRALREAIAGSVLIGYFFVFSLMLFISGFRHALSSGDAGQAIYTQFTVMVTTIVGSFFVAEAVVAHAKPKVEVVAHAKPMDESTLEPPRSPSGAPPVPETIS